jgi:hypothetical protein
MLFNLVSFAELRMVAISDMIPGERSNGFARSWESVAAIGARFIMLGISIRVLFTSIRGWGLILMCADSPLRTLEIDRSIATLLAVSYTERSGIALELNTSNVIA